MRILKFKTNINCNNCIRSVTPFLNEVDSIEEWRVDIDDEDKILTVESENGLKEDVIDAVKKAGFDIVESS